MKIFSSTQISEIDSYTIKNEPISSLDLMERAAKAWTAKFLTDYDKAKNISIGILCGPGNNGGDGLAIARLLHEKNIQVAVYRLCCDGNETMDHLANLSRLNQTVPVSNIKIGENDFETILRHELIIDAIFGAGINRPITGTLAAFIELINAQNKSVVAVDMPSGMMCDKPTEGVILKCNHCYTFEFPKLALLLPESNAFVKHWAVVPIQLSKIIQNEQPTTYFFTQRNDVEKIYKERLNFSHKGSNGHGLLISGSFGKMGAAILSGRSALKSGCGLLDIHIPKIGYDLMQRSFPEAMVSVDDNNNYISKIPNNLSAYSAIGIGPGLGKAPCTANAIEDFLARLKCPSVWDADALNLLAENKMLLNKLPEQTIFTPHPGEFRRLVGSWKNDFDKISMLRKFSEKYKIIVVLKGAFTCVATPNGYLHFNSTGNPGMATAGSGDVLTGVILGLLCQKYSPVEAAILGVFLHGLSGDIALEKESMESTIASDIILNLGAAFKTLIVSDK